MTDYIKREDAVNVCKTWMNCAGFSGLTKGLEALINNIPTADVVEVVRCEECIYKHKDDAECGECGDKLSDDCYYCTRWGRCTRIWGFCSYGERKENECT